MAHSQFDSVMGLFQVKKKKPTKKKKKNKQKRRKCPEMAFRPSHWDCSIRICCSHQSHCGIRFFKRKIWSFCWWSEVNLLNSSGNWLLILIQVIQIIETEFPISNLQKNIYNRIWEHYGNYTNNSTHPPQAQWILLNNRFNLVLEIVQQYSLHHRQINIKCTVLCKSNAREVREFLFLFKWTFVAIPCEGSSDNLRFF